MEWRDCGIVLAHRPYGETDSILELLSQKHGRHMGLVHGGRSRRLRAALQPGNSLDVVWRARLDEHLGTWKVELREARAAALMRQEISVTAAMAATSVCRLLPERDSCRRVHDGLEALLAGIIAADQNWPLRFVCWELQFLRELGYGLDLESCALGGPREDIGYVSPRSGKAASIQEGAAFADRLLNLPGFLHPGKSEEVEAGNYPVVAEEIVEGLRLSGHFLVRWGFQAYGRGLPRARLRLQKLFERRMEVPPARPSIAASVHPPLPQARERVDNREPECGSANSRPPQRRPKALTGTA